MPTIELPCGNETGHGMHSWTEPDTGLVLPARRLCPGYRPQPPDDTSWPLARRPRWCYGRQRSYAWAQCRYCGGARANDCAPALCPLCGSVQCRNSAQCHVCLHGALDGFYRPDGRDKCGYKGCSETAVAERLPRIKRCCAGHVERVKLRYGGGSVFLEEYVAARVAHRDSGKGWENWRLVA